MLLQKSELSNNYTHCSEINVTKTSHDLWPSVSKESKYPDIVLT